MTQLAPLTPRAVAFDWHEHPDALRLLAEVDAAERSSDAYLGRGWDGVAEAFASQARDAECALEDLHSQAVYALADIYCEDRQSGGWCEAWGEADDELLSVKDAVQRARRSHAGDALFEQADAA